MWGAEEVFRESGDSYNCVEGPRDETQVTSRLAASVFSPAEPTRQPSRRDLLTMCIITLLQTFFKRQGLEYPKLA